MNDKSQLMNAAQQMMSQLPPPPPQMMTQPLPQVMNPVQSQIINQTQLLGQSQAMSHSSVCMGQPQGMNLSHSHGMMNQPLMMNSRSFNPSPNMNKIFQSTSSSSKPNNFVPGSKQPKTNRSNWKGKNVTTDKRLMKDPVRRMDYPMSNTAIPVGPGGTRGYNPEQLPSSGILVGPGGTGGYKPPTLNELQSQNRLKTRKFYPKKKFNNRYVPYAPRNTTSFIIRAKKSGGIAELVSPYPVTPAVLPTPIFSPSREVLGDMAKEEWGVDGYGSMKGLIRLRSDGHELEPHDEEEEEGGSSESDVEEHVEVERRLDHDLSRFEMIYPNHGGFDYNNVLENRVDDQDTHITQLEEENLTLKERLFLMERELGDLRRRLQFLERQNMVAEDVHEEVVESESENDSDAVGSDARASLDTKEEDNHVDTEDLHMEDAARETNHESKVEETKKKSMDAQVMPKEDKIDAQETENRDLVGDEMVAVKQDNESKHESEAMDTCRGKETVTERQIDESRFEKAVQEDKIDAQETEKRDVVGDEMVAVKQDN